MNCNVEEIIRKRKSVRTFEKRPLVKSDKNAIIACLGELSKEVSPFPAEIRFQFLDIKDGVNTEKLGTYGVIKNAPAFIGVTVKKTETAMEAVGYLFEKFILLTKFFNTSIFLVIGKDASNSIFSSNSVK